MCVLFSVNFGGVASANSPHRVYVGLPVDANKVQAFGPWFQPGVHPNSPTHFNVDCRDAGEAELKVKIVHEETKVEIPCRIIDNEDQTYSVEVIPPTKGAYTTTMTYGGQPVPLGQKVMVEQQIDVSKIKVDGLEPSKYFKRPIHTHIHKIPFITYIHVKIQLELPFWGGSKNS